MASLTSAPSDWATYAEVLPATGPALGQGLTPLVEATLDGSAVRLKLEFTNPTGSFKDRAVSVSIGAVVQRGARGLVVASSGNAGVSTAAFGAAAGLPVVVLVPPTVTTPKVAQLRSLGALILPIEDLFGDELRLRSTLEQLEAVTGFANVMTFAPLNPFGVEGYRTIAYEIGAARHRVRPPTHVATASAGGDSVLGLIEGFNDLESIGWIHQAPTVIAVQPEGYASLAPGGTGPGREPSRLLAPITSAFASFEAAAALAAAGGVVVTVTEAEAVNARDRLAREVGMLVETSSAAALAGVWRLAGEGQLGSDPEVIVILGSHGLKEEVVEATPPDPVGWEDLSAVVAHWATGSLEGPTGHQGPAAS
jgi:threonine synthase